MTLNDQLLKQDIDEICNNLKSESYCPPSMWRIVRPGVFMIFGITLFQLLFASRDIMYESANIYSNGIASVGFSFFLGLIIGFSAINLNAVILSLPDIIKTRSIIFRVFYKKIRVYCIAWCILNLLAGVTFLWLPAGGSILASIVQLVTYVFFFMIFNVDISRYHAAKLRLVIDGWRESKKS